MTPTPLHIVMLIDAWFPKDETSPGVWGGGQVHVRELRSRLVADYGCQVELFYAAHKNLLIRSLWVLWVVADVLLYSRYHPQIHLLHSHGYYSGLAAKLIGFFLKVPVVHTVHATPALDQAKKSPKLLIEKWLLTKLHYQAEISLSSHFLKYPNVNQRLSVIPNGVNIQAFNQVRVVKYPTTTLIWVGQADPSKGLAVLKAALVKVRRLYPELKTELVTGGRLSGRAIIKAYKKSHLFCLPSLAESQPIALLEAWAAKLPVVVTRFGENQTMVKSGINGLLVDPGNAQQLAKALLQLLRSPRRATAMGLAGYNLVKNHYSWDQVVAQTYAVYLEVLQTSAMAAENKLVFGLNPHEN